MSFHLRSVARLATAVVFCVLGGHSCAAADLLISDNFGNQVLRYDQTTGAFLGVFISSDSNQNGGLSGPIGMRYRDNGNLLVTSQFTNSILEYDGQTGDFLGIFAASGLNQPADLQFASNGSLLVANFGGNGLSSFTASGSPLGTFTSGGPGIAGTSSFAFGPNDDVYVGSFYDGSIQRFDGTTGAYQGTFAAGLAGPAGLLFDGDGSLWVANLFADSISHFASDGSLLGNFSTGSSTFPSYIIANPNNSGELLVALTGAGGVYRFGKNGTEYGMFAGGGGLIVPGQMLLTQAIPEPGSLSALALLGALVALSWRKRRV